MLRFRLLLALLFIVLMAVISILIINANKETTKVIVPECCVNIVEEVTEESLLICEMPLYDIPLSLELQRKIWRLAESYNLPELSTEQIYNTIISIIAIESEFNERAVSHTSDYGLMQININYTKYHAEKAGLGRLDLFNPKYNIQLGVFILCNYKANRFVKMGYVGEELLVMMLSGYNRGVSGTINNGIAVNYVNKVLSYKSNLKVLIRK